MPKLIEQTLLIDNDVQSIASTFNEAKGSMFLGRGFSYPIALEGALKLKELSYVHAEGYPAGEMKHGPNVLHFRSYERVQSRKSFIHKKNFSVSC